MTGATGAPVTPAVPAPKLVEAVTENEYNADAGLNDAAGTVTEVADPPTDTVCGLLPGAGTYPLPCAATC